MAKKEKEYISEKYEYEYRQQYQEDWDNHTTYTADFDAYEAMLAGYVYDTVSNSIDGGRITDSYATTLAIERAARVMGKLPEGVTESVSSGDAGKGAFMDVLRQKWIYPNANAQHRFKIKLRLWQLYSSVYGYMPMFYDWDVKDNGYIGPDCWLWNPRLFIPQSGRISVQDMSYVNAGTTVGSEYIENILDNEEEDDGWDRDALRDLLDHAKKMVREPDTQEDSFITRSRNPSGGKKGILLMTRYESGEDGEWITFAPEHGWQEVRRLKNPHKNGRIPFVIKYSQPLFDSFYGMGDFQRAKPLQFARDGLTNFYFKGIKMNLIPPIVANANGIMKHTIDYREGGVMLETIPNSIRRLETSTAGLATYQAAQTSLTGSLLSLFGTQNASIPGAEALNPSQGKTPAAIRMFQEREATRDGQDREFMEEAIEELTDGFFSLVANIGTEEIPVQLFAQDIQEIVDNGLEDVLGIFTNKFTPDSKLVAGQLKINPSSLKGIEYRFNITPGSTAKLNKDIQRESLKDLLATVAKYQNVIQDDPNTTVNWGVMLNALEQLSDIKGLKDFITVQDGPTPTEAMLIEENQQLQQAIQQLQGQMRAVSQSNLAPATMNVGGQEFANEQIAKAAQQLM